MPIIQSGPCNFITMNCALLAKTSTDGLSLHPFTHFPAQTDLVPWCQEMGPATGILLVLIGVIYLLYGWSFFKALVTLNGAILGGYIGALLGVRFGSSVLGGFAGAIAAAAITF